MNNRFRGIVFILVLLFACKKKEVDQFYIIFSPAADVISVDLESLDMNLKLYSSEGLSTLDVYLSSDQRPEQLAFSKTYSGSISENSTVTLDFSPDFNRGTSVYGKFVLTDIQGKRLEYLKRFDLTQEVSLSLVEDASFFSRNSELFNAFSLEQASSLNFDGFNSQGLADLVELTNDTSTNPYQLSYKWYSPTQCGIARVPNLNFNEVTKDQLGVVFESNVCMDYTDSLVVGDVYVFKKNITGAPRYFVVKITGMESGSTPGRYIFDLRK
jgi:hypothetical protein